MKYLPNHLCNFILGLSHNNLGENPENLKYFAETMKQLPNNLQYFKLDLANNFLDAFDIKRLDEIQAELKKLHLLYSYD